jgi:hypothetical protein
VSWWGANRNLQSALCRLACLDGHKTQDEVREEELAMCRRRRLEPRPAGGSLLYVLTPDEVVRLQEYDRLRLLAGVPLSNNIIYNLGDDPRNRLIWTINSKSIPTYRKSPTLFWIPALGRWMTACEKLATLGWPVFEQLAIGSDMPLLRVDRDTARRMLGNSVCLPNIGLALLSGLAICEFVR